MSTQRFSRQTSISRTFEQLFFTLFTTIFVLVTVFVCLFAAVAADVPFAPPPSRLCTRYVGYPIFNLERTMQLLTTLNMLLCRR